MKKRTVEEIEQESEMDLDTAMYEYIGSCARTNHADDNDNIKWFMRENNIVKSDYHIVAESYYRILEQDFMF